MERQDSVEEVNTYLLRQPSFWIAVVVVLGAAAAPIYGAWRALNGSWRSWVLADPTRTQISSRNHIPFMALCFGVAIVVVLPTIVFEIIGWESARQFMWNGPFWIPWGGLIVSLVWWPKWLTPKWYRTWCTNAAQGNPMPFTSEDIAHIEKMPPSKWRDRAEKNLTVCQGYFT